MKPNEAPDKIYLIRNTTSPTSLNTTDDGRDKYLSEWYKGREKDSDIEYIRTDVFIEKACDWLEPLIKGLAEYYCGEDLLNDFKNYMKGE